MAVAVADALFCSWFLLLEGLNLQLLVVGVVTSWGVLNLLLVWNLVAVESPIGFGSLPALLGAPLPVPRHIALRRRRRASLRGVARRRALDQGFSLPLPCLSLSFF